MKLSEIIGNPTHLENMRKVAEFACERQWIYVNKQRGAPAPWTEDPILQNYKFTNTHRVLDRTSQYLIANIINPVRKGTPLASDRLSHRNQILNLTAQIYLFKLFNSVDTWSRLRATCREYTDLPCSHLSVIRHWAHDERRHGRKVYSSAYALCTSDKKYDNRTDMYFATLNKILDDPDVRNSTSRGRLISGNTVEDTFNYFRAHYGFGDFLAYQFALDFSYAAITKDNVSDTLFVVPGPGCVRGMQKVFGDVTNTTMRAILRGLTLEQREFWVQVERDYPYAHYENAEGQERQLILEVNDWQNIFCEFDKYSRLAYPEMHEKYEPLRGLRNKYSASKALPVTRMVVPNGWTICR